MKEVNNSMFDFIYRNRKYNSENDMWRLLEGEIDYTYYNVRKFGKSAYYIICKKCGKKHSIFDYINGKTYLNLKKCNNCEKAKNVFIDCNITLETDIDLILKEKIHSIKTYRKLEGKNSPLKGCKEKIYLNFITNYFKQEEFIAQFTVRDKIKRKYYKVDLYMPHVNLVIECDEYGHKDRNTFCESKREKFIKNELNCNFVRFNPDDKMFKIKNVIVEIELIINGIS